MPSLMDDAPTSSSIQATLNSCALASFAALIIAYFWLIDAFAVNTVWVDQWSDLALINHTYSGHLTLSALWAQHTDNRILFPNLVVLLLAKTTHFNVVDEAFLSGCLLVIATSLLIVGHRRRLKSTPWVFYVPVAIVMFSFVQNDNTLWGFQFAWYLVLLALSMALVLCDDPRWSWLIAAAAMAAAVIGSYSSVQGLLIWPSALVLLLLRRRPLPFVLVWIAVGAATTALYFVNFNTHNGASSSGYVFHHPIQGIRFFFFSVGNVTGTHGGNGSVALGILIVLMALGLVLTALISSRGDEAAPLGIALICYGLLFALFITDGRAAAGLDAGNDSRYMTFNLLTLVGCYLVIISMRGALHREHGSFKFLWWASLGLVGVAVCLTLILGTINGVDDATSWQKEQIQASRVIVNIKRAPDSMVERVLHVNPYFLSQYRALSAFAEENKLSLFANAETVGLYQRAGLPYDAKSLVTAMTLPESGESVKGVVLLVASASSDYGVARVDFEVSDATGYRTQLSGANSPYGWFATWNPSGLANGRYVIHSVAYDQTSHRAVSANAAVFLKT
jgi:hypothetical protein